MHVLVTGHTGFKGAWLTSLLKQRGYDVSGLALDPAAGSLFSRARIHEDLEHDVRLDVRDGARVKDAFAEIAPDVVIHMAAQPLVRESYRDPRYTFETNVNGTLNVLDATASTPSIRAQLIVTTDKVYRNVGKMQGYVETDPLGGEDPYSASKAMADVLTQSWITSFGGTPTAIARAGNVIGGCDVSPERLLPDLMNAFTEETPAAIRYPDAVRPWQHVLDCLNGYLAIVDALLQGQGAGAWNIGPDPTAFLTVGDVATLAAQRWGEGAAWEHVGGEHLKEAALLTLDSAKAHEQLGWRERLTAHDAVAWTVDWHTAAHSGADARNLMRADIDRFNAL